MASEKQATKKVEREARRWFLYGKDYYLATHLLREQLPVPTFPSPFEATMFGAGYTEEAADAQSVQAALGQ